MSLNATPSGERIHIGFFGMVNAGKSSLANAFTSQSLSIVSDTPGTTTDPVQKAMELLPLGPVVIIDTPGLGDDTSLGQERMKRTMEALGRCDGAILVHDCTMPLEKPELSILEHLALEGKKCIIALNKSDLGSCRDISAGIENTSDDSENISTSCKNISDDNDGISATNEHQMIQVSALTGDNIKELRELAAKVFLPAQKKEQPLIRDILPAGKMTVLVIPIDESAPKGRLILPQQMVMRDILDAHAPFAACQPQELSDFISRFRIHIGLVVTDSQVFEKVAEIVPEEIGLTSFSILLARYRGELEYQLEGLRLLKELKDGDNILISEACSHHRQCNDIGAVRLPGWIDDFSGRKLKYSFTSGGEFPDDLTDIRLVVHCGGCMINDAQMRERMKRARDAGVPAVNYGMAIAYMKGIIKRAIAVL